MSLNKHCKLKERINLADRILCNGIPMPSCSNCERARRTCIISPDSRRCSECVHRNLKCNATAPTASQWEKLRKEEERLELEEELAAQQEQEAFARRMRIRKMQKSLKERGAEMLRRGLKTLNELDEAEEKERKKAETEASPQATTESSAYDAASSNLFSALSPSF